MIGYTLLFFIIVNMIIINVQMTCNLLFIFVKHNSYTFEFFLAEEYMEKS